MRAGGGTAEFEKEPGSMNRRDFLKVTGAAALGAATLGAGSLSAVEKLTVNGLPGTVFGRTGLEITKISFGGILTDEPPVLLRVIDQGFKLVHTAPGYQNGRSIAAFGKVLKTRRQEVALAVKVRPGKELDKSLKTLNTDYADFIVPPMDSLEEISDPALREDFEKARQAGKCGHMGFACHTQSAALIDRMVELGFYDLILMSYADLKTPEFVAALQRARQAGIGIMAMKGLPKRASADPNAEERALTASLCSSMVGRFHAHTVLASMGSFQAVEMYRNILENSLGFVSPRLEERWWAQQEGNYCAMCGNCKSICPRGVEVSSIVRYRMYYNDYKLTDYARAKYATLCPGKDASNCAGCGRCESVCSRKLPLRAMLEEAHANLA